jgi:hypothetical protein
LLPTAFTQHHWEKLKSIKLLAEKSRNAVTWKTDREKDKPETDPRVVWIIGLGGVDTCHQRIQWKALIQECMGTNIQ